MKCENIYCNNKADCPVCKIICKDCCKLAQTQPLKLESEN